MRNTLQLKWCRTCRHLLRDRAERHVMSVVMTPDSILVLFDNVWERSHSLSFLNKCYPAWDKYDFHCTCGWMTSDQERSVAVCCVCCLLMSCETNVGIQRVTRKVDSFEFFISWMQQTLLRAGRKFKLFIENQWNWVKFSSKQFFNWIEFSMLYNHRIAKWCQWF